MTDETRPTFPPMLFDAINKPAPSDDTLRASLAVLLQASTNMVQRIDQLEAQMAALHAADSELETIEATMAAMNAETDEVIAKLNAMTAPRKWNLLKWLRRF